MTELVGDPGTCCQMLSRALFELPATAQSSYSCKEGRHIHPGLMFAFDTNERIRGPHFKGLEPDGD